MDFEANRTPESYMRDKCDALAKTVDYKGKDSWFHFRIHPKGVLLYQYKQHTYCTTSGEKTWQGGRKFYISPHMTDGEVLRTIFLSVKLFEEHEINETFLVDGERFLNPHPEGPRPQS